MVTKVSEFTKSLRNLCQDRGWGAPELAAAMTLKGLRTDARMAKRWISDGTLPVLATRKAIARSFRGYFEEKKP